MSHVPAFNDNTQNLSRPKAILITEAPNIR